MGFDVLSVIPGLDPDTVTDRELRYAITRLTCADPEEVIEAGLLASGSVPTWRTHARSKPEIGCAFYTGRGEVIGEVLIDSSMARETVWIAHGWHSQNVNRMTDAAPDLLTGQPSVTAVPVEVERISS